MTSDVPTLAKRLGWILILLGVLTYLASGRSSLTALIPAAFGAALLLLGIVAGRAASPKHPMHAAAVVALLGFAGSVGGLVDLARLAVGGQTDAPAMAVASKSLMAVGMAAFLVFCIRSFRQARLAGKGGGD